MSLGVEVMHWTETTHEGETQNKQSFKCDQCHKEFMSSTQLDEHISKKLQHQTPGLQEHL